MLLYKQIKGLIKKKKTKQTD